MPDLRTRLDKLERQSASASNGRVFRVVGGEYALDDVERFVTSRQPIDPPDRIVYRSLWRAGAAGPVASNHPLRMTIPKLYELHSRGGEELP